jgi:hypothetical protein
MEKNNRMNSKKKWMKLGTQEKVLWSVLILLLVFVYMTYCYTDVLLIIRHSFGIFDTFRMGRPWTFYSYSTAQSLGTSFPISGEVPYDYWVYIPIALWNLPIYIWEQVTGGTFETHLLAVWWGKALFLIPLYGCLYALRAIVRESLDKMENVRPKQETDRYVSVTWFLFLSSIFLIHGLGMLTQIDVMNLCCTLFGIRAVLQKNRRQFYIWFALACTCKMLGFFVAVPLILLQEKRILCIVRDVLLVGSLTLLSKIIFFRDKMNCPTTFDEIRFSQYLYKSTMESGKGVFYLFFVAFILVLAYAYSCHAKTMNENYFRQVVLWTAFLGIAVFFLFSNTQSYWIVLLSPYVPLLVLYHEKQRKLAVYLDTAAGAAYLVISMLAFPLFYTEMMNMDFGIFHRIFPSLACRSIADFAAGHGVVVEQAIAVANSFWVAAMIALIVLLRPQKNHAEETETMDMEPLWVRLAVAAVCVMIPVVMIVQS